MTTPASAPDTAVATSAKVGAAWAGTILGFELGDVASIAGIAAASATVVYTVLMIYLTVRDRIVRDKGGVG
jgi:hypothetical protein